jgi:hypothetical protein
MLVVFPHGDFQIKDYYGDRPWNLIDAASPGMGYPYLSPRRRDVVVLQAVAGSDGRSYPPTHHLKQLPSRAISTQQSGAAAAAEREGAHLVLPVAEVGARRTTWCTLHECTLRARYVHGA